MLTVQERFEQVMHVCCYGEEQLIDFCFFTAAPSQKLSLRLLTQYLGEHCNEQACTGRIL